MLWQVLSATQSVGCFSFSITVLTQALFQIQKGHCFCFQILFSKFIVFVVENFVIFFALFQCDERDASVEARAEITKAREAPRGKTRQRLQ